MTETPGPAPGSRSWSSPAGEPRAAWTRPRRALLVAAAGFTVVVVLLATLPLRADSSVAVSWMNSLLMIAIVFVPLAAAVLVAGHWASAAGTARATGIRTWYMTDVLLGAGVGLVLRSVVELIAPTTGSLLSPLSDGSNEAATMMALAVSVVAAVMVSPVVEELFFRGLVLRACLDAIGTGRVVASALAVVISTGAFVALHAITNGGVITAPLLLATAAVGVGCGIVTAATGRLAAAIVGHMTFNAIGLVLLLV